MPGQISQKEQTELLNIWQQRTLHLEKHFLETNVSSQLYKTELPAIKLCLDHISQPPQLGL